MEISNTIRRKIIEYHQKNKLSHCASALSCVDILVALYYVNSDIPSKFILSKGHAKTAWYAVNKYFGLLPPEEPSCSLGNGLGIGCGMALAGYKTYVLMSDGELQEGSTWEALMFAGHHKLKNLVAIIDYNKFQACGKIKDVLGIEPLGDKFRAFGWKVTEADGHDFRNLIWLLEKEYDVPHIVIAHTIKGKGLNGGEDSNKYHYQYPE